MRGILPGRELFSGAGIWQTGQYARAIPTAAQLPSVIPSVAEESKAVDAAGLGY